jgi:hypothetical protein
MATKGQAMTGDDLITLVTEAGSDAEARAIMDTAPALAVVAAADLLYVSDAITGIRPLRNAVLQEARA